MISHEPKPEQTNAEAELLREENEHFRLKILAYETMIELAEKELGISIKKSPQPGCYPAPGIKARAQRGIYLPFVGHQQAGMV